MSGGKAPAAAPAAPASDAASPCESDSEDVPAKAAGDVPIVLNPRVRVGSGKQQQKRRKGSHEQHN